MPPCPPGRRRWTQDRLVRAVRRLVAEGLADPALLAPAPRRQAPDRLVAIVAGIARSAPHLTLRAIGAELARLRERTPRGGLHWSPSSSRTCSAGPQGRAGAALIRAASARYCGRYAAVRRSRRLGAGHSTEPMMRANADGGPCPGGPTTLRTKGIDRMWRNLENTR